MCNAAVALKAEDFAVNIRKTVDHLGLLLFHEYSGLALNQFMGRRAGNERRGAARRIFAKSPVPAQSEETPRTDVPRWHGASL